MAERRKIDDDRLDAGLKALFDDEADPGRSVLARIEARGSVVQRVVLRDVQADPSPVVRPEAGGERQTGRYRIAGELARGGVGTVYKGRDVDLGRDVAIKLLHAEHADRAELVARFVEEAQIGGQLQHPGIVPVHELGLQEDGRPYFAMKLVKGKTLASLLAGRADPARDRRRFLRVFEQVCETVAYAHARGVIHRDLKPSNVMVGAFGEVQIVDWGFAKVLALGGVADEERAERAHDQTVVATVRSARRGSESLTGSVMGTPAYMPPEQALGEVDRMDERSDVFALGSILCEILTGRPAYVGERHELLAHAAQARLDDAYARLRRCGADRGLVTLARRCLSPEPAARPGDAAELARAVADHFSAHEERTRRAEMAVAEARAKAEESGKRVLVERRARRLTLGLAAAVLGAIALGGLSYAWVSREREQRRATAAVPVRRALDEAMVLRGEARAAPVDDPGRWPGVIARAREAIALARDAGASPSELRSAEEFLAAVEQERQAAEQAAEAARSSRALVDALREVQLKRPPDFGDEEVEKGYREAFAGYGLDVDALEPKELGARIRESPARLELVAALDTWTRCSDRFLEACQAADDDPFRTRVRVLTNGNGKQAVLELMRSADLESLPMESLLLLASALGVSMENDQAVNLATIEALRVAQGRWPREFWPNFWLGRCLIVSVPEVSRSSLTGNADAPRYLAIAHTLIPESIGASYQLGHACLAKAELSAAVDAFREVYLRDPDYGRIRERYRDALLSLAKARSEANAYESAIRLFQEARELDPRNLQVLWNLGEVLRVTDPEQAIDVFRAALEIDPSAANAHNGLANALRLSGREAEAIEEYHKALEVAPNHPLILWNLGLLYGTKRNWEEAVRWFEKAVAAAPQGDYALSNLAFVYEKAGRMEDAIRVMRVRAAANPSRPPLQFDVVTALEMAGDAEGAAAASREFVDRCRKGLSETPDDVMWKHALAAWYVMRPDSGIDGAEALRLIEQASRMRPDLVHVQVMWGFVAYRAGQYRRAIEILEKYRGYRGFDVLCYLAMSYWRAGQRDEALATYRLVDAGLFERPNYLNPDHNLRALLAETTRLLGVGK